MQPVNLQQFDMEKIFSAMDANPLLPFGMLALFFVLFLLRFRGKRE